MTTQPYIPVSDLDHLMTKLANECVGSGTRRHIGMSMSSAESVQGHFRTARSVSREIMPDVPRPFRVDDPPASMEVGSLNGRPIGEQILLQTVRCRQRVFEAELDFTLLLDTSRSMLAFDTAGPLKLDRLFTWATAFLTVAGWARFYLHVTAGNEFRVEGPARGRESARLLPQMLFDQIPETLRAA